MKLLKIILMLLLLTTIIDAQDRNQKLMKLSKKIEQSEFKNVKKTIIAIAVLESVWFQSQRHREFKNYFSVKDWKHEKCSEKPIFCMKQFESFDDNIDYMIQYFKKKGFPTEKEEFIAHLKKIGYAEDRQYETKLRAVRKSVKKKLDFLEK